MAFESNNFNVAKKYRLPKSEFTVNCNIEADGEISRIFTVSADVTVDTKEVLAGSVTYGGIIETCMVYLTENGEVGSVHTSCPFSSRFDDTNISVDQKAVIRASVVSYSIGDIVNNNVSITYTLKQSGFVVSNKEIRSISAGDDDVAVRQEDIKVVHFIGDATCPFCAQIPLITREPIKKLLLCESQASIKEVETGLNFVSVSGEVVSRLLYLTESDRFETAYVFDSFKQELEIDGVTRESQAEACAFVKYSEVKAVVNNEEKGAKIEVSVPVDICVMAYNEVEVNVVADLYSTRNEVEVETASFDMTRSLPIEIVEGKIEGNLLIDEDKPRVDKVLFSAGNFVDITNITSLDGMVKIEGIAKTNVVYLNDETNSLNSVEVEVPFVLNDRISIPEEAQLSAVAVISDVDVAVKKGRELFYDAKIKVFVYADQEVISAVISNAALKDELAEKDYAMEIVFGKTGQTAWDIAKANKIQERMVIMQNPETVFPLTENTEVVLFYQNNKK